ncbi:MAG TPA: polysaccharide biosynthesis protein [Pseudorhodoferax sp.]|jgi:UDP-glucose 4-epimerase|nr:polysaccharide biosynthesis protein [Pseudorhodoferax sp.]
MNIEGQRILVTGGTGSLGQVLVRRLLSGEFGQPDKVVVFSRDEAKQHDMRLHLNAWRATTDEVIFANFTRQLQFRIGDVRDPAALRAAVDGMDLIVNAAAMKQVPTCEYFPEEAHSTNVGGAVNLLNLLRDLRRPVRTVVGVSTDKAVHPVNVMGMTKALQERVLIRANLDCPDTRFVLVRYGNVLASRGSVVPLFLDQIRHGGPLTITDERMTRFLMTLNHAVDTIAQAVAEGRRGEIFIPRAPAARIVDLARALMGEHDLPLRFTGIRPGEKLHEVLVAEEEVPRTTQCKDYLAIRPMLPELLGDTSHPKAALPGEYNSSTDLLDAPRLRALLEGHGLVAGQAQARAAQEGGELLL